MRMSEVIIEKSFVELPQDADKRTVITLLVKSLASSRKLKPNQVEEVIEGTMSREMIGSTGIGHGIAIPHCKTALVSKIICAYGHCQEGVDFDSLDGEPVHSVFLLLTPIDRKEDYLALMKNFAIQIRKEHFSEFLQQTVDAKGLIDLLTEFESR